MVTDVLQRPRRRTRRRRRAKPAETSVPYSPLLLPPPTAPTASGTSRWLGGDTADGGGLLINGSHPQEPEF